MQKKKLSKRFYEPIKRSGKFFCLIELRIYMKKDRRQVDKYI